MEQINNSITFYAFFVESKLGKTGLTTTIDVYETTQAGVTTQIVTGGSALEVGGGLYKYVLASGSVDAVGEYIAVFKTATTTVDAQHIPALWIVGRDGNENLDAAISTRATPTNITAGTITTVTNLTNAPTSGDLTATMKTSVTTAATAATPTAAAVTGAVGSVTAPVTAGTVSDKTGYALSAGGVQAIWDALTTALTATGSIGKRIADYLDAAISSRGTSTYAGGDTSGVTTLLTRIVGTLATGTHSPQTGDAFARLGAPVGVSVSADVAAAKADTAAILVDTGTTLDTLIKDIPTNAELASALATADDAVLTAIADVPTVAEFEARTLAAADYTIVSDLPAAAPTAAAVADQVWDEALSGHAIAGSTGAFLAASGAASDPLLNLVPGAYASGTAGAALGNIAGAAVTVVSPVAADGTAITLTYGDDYAAADNRALVFTALTGPVLTGGAVALRVQAGAGVVNLAGVVTGAHACYVELTDVQVATIDVGVWRYDLQATLVTTANVVTLVTGYVTVAADVR